MPRPLLLPLRETAAEIGIPPKTLRAHVQSGRAPCHRIGATAKIYFSQADIAAFLQAIITWDAWLRYRSVALTRQSWAGDRCHPWLMRGCNTFGSC